MKRRRLIEREKWLHTGCGATENTGSDTKTKSRRNHKWFPFVYSDYSTIDFVLNFQIIITLIYYPQMFQENKIHSKGVYSIENL